ncbi:MAG: serine hydrolase domain-containing protein, partial [bacterium]
AVSGQSYPEFVQKEILSPLGMVNSRYTDQKLAPGSYARPHSGDTPQEYFSLNMYATGGLYSTADDMAHLGSMLINGGVYNNRQILSAQSIAAMAEDQTLASFNPLPSDYMPFGLGWDTVASGGLKAVGVKAWGKGGDMDGQYASQFVVVPEERLAVTVIGASNGISSSKLLKVAERVLLAALVERGKLTAMPKPLDSSVQRPLVSPTDQEKTDTSGDYASNSALYRVLFSGDTLSVLQYGEDGEWSDWQTGLKLRNDGWYAADKDAVFALRSVAGGGRQYLAIRFPASGIGHYFTTLILAKKLTKNRPQLSDAWIARTGEQWLPVNNSNMCIDDSNKACLSLSAKNLPTGYLAANGEVLSDMSPPTNEKLDGMILLIPQAMGRDLNDLTVKQVQGVEWLLFGSTLYRPVSGVENLAAGKSSVAIGSDAAIEWRKLPATGTLSVSGTTVWRIFDSAFAPLVYRSGNGSASLTGAGAKYLMLYSETGTTISMELKP